MSYWKKYNEKLSSMTQAMIEHNKNNKFNAVEQLFYPHVRDILGITLSILQNNQTDKLLQILDYGSNPAVWANFQNKLNTNLLDLSIYDPFAEEGVKEIATLPFKKMIVSSNLYNLSRQRYDLTIFGSSSQYDSDFIKDWDKQRQIDTDYILFTHTPLSLGSGFSSKQFSDYTGLQTIHSFDDILTKLESKSFDLIFKSTLSNHYSSVEERFLPQTVYANLLFKRVY